MTMTIYAPEFDLGSLNFADGLRVTARGPVRIDGHTIEIDVQGNVIVDGVAPAGEVPAEFRSLLGEWHRPRGGAEPLDLSRESESRAVTAAEATQIGDLIRANHESIWIWTRRESGNSYWERHERTALALAGNARISAEELRDATSELILEDIVSELSGGWIAHFPHIGKVALRVSEINTRGVLDNLRDMRLILDADTPDSPRATRNGGQEVTLSST